MVHWYSVHNMSNSMHRQSHTSTDASRQIMRSGTIHRQPLTNLAVLPFDQAPTNTVYSSAPARKNNSLPLCAPLVSQDKLEGQESRGNTKECSPSLICMATLCPVSNHALNLRRNAASLHRVAWLTCLVQWCTH